MSFFFQQVIKAFSGDLKQNCQVFIIEHYKDEKKWKSVLPHQTEISLQSEAKRIKSCGDLITKFFCE